MSANNKPDFETFVALLKTTNATLSFFSDFDKISWNVESIAISLHTLNYLIGKQDLKKAVAELWKRDKSVFSVMPILVAVRDAEERLILTEQGDVKALSTLFETPNGVVKYLEGTGLANVFRNAGVKDLHDFVFGVETGLDTNARKNRSGQVTESWFANYLSEAGVPFRRQVRSAQYPQVTEALGTDRRKFDFAITTPQKIYLIEVNFYNGGGSKPNSIAREYPDLAHRINACAGFEFVWVTDGQGWLTATNILEEAYRAIPSVYNFATLDKFIARVKRELS